MNTIENHIKRIAKEAGAALVSIANRERLHEFPPSGDSGYLLPSASSIISFAIPLYRNILRDYLRKKDWLPHGANRKHILQGLDGINDCLENFLKSKGYEAKGVEGKCVYRSEIGAEDTTDMIDFIPDFSIDTGQ